MLRAHFNTALGETEPKVASIDRGRRPDHDGAAERDRLAYQLKPSRFMESHPIDSEQPPVLVRVGITCIPPIVESSPTGGVEEGVFFALMHEAPGAGVPRWS